MTNLPRELLGGTDEVAPPVAPPLTCCSRCGTTELDHVGDCPACSSAALEERIRAAQEDRTPEPWSFVVDGDRRWGRPHATTYRHLDSDDLRCDECGAPPECYHEEDCSKFRGYADGTLRFFTEEGYQVALGEIERLTIWVDGDVLDNELL